MNTLVIIGCVVLYLAAGYITAWHWCRLLKDYEDGSILPATLCWPLMLSAGLLYLLLCYLPRKIFNKIRKK